MNRLWSVSVSTLSPVLGRVKLGHPVPESNLSSESKSGLPQQTQRYRPGSFDALYLPVNAGSVPFFLVIRYCSGVSSARHSSSVLRIFSVIVPYWLLGLHSLYAAIAGSVCNPVPRPILGAAINRTCRESRISRSQIDRIHSRGGRHCRIVRPGEARARIRAAEHHDRFDARTAEDCSDQVWKSQLLGGNGKPRHGFCLET